MLETEECDTWELTEKSVALLRRIRFENISHELLQTSQGGADTYALSEPCKLGDIDFFISHSWSDDAGLKYQKIVEVNAQFEKENRRAATLWLDKVCIIDQENIQDALRCLPVFEMACQKLLMTVGKTYGRSFLSPSLNRGASQAHHTI